MKLILTTVLAVLILAASFTLQAAESDVDKVGIFATEQADAEWWTIPYPGRFDTALLSKKQSLISVKGNSFVDSEGNTFVFRGMNIADPDKLAREGQWAKPLFEEVHLAFDRQPRNRAIPAPPVCDRYRRNSQLLEKHRASLQGGRHGCCL